MEKRETSIGSLRITEDMSAIKGWDILGAW
jgi:hypothetical protein